MDKVKSKLNGFDLFKVSIRMLFLQGALHQKGMQNIGFVNALAASSRKLAGDQNDTLLRRHLGFFNCNPNFSSLILGGVLRLEEERVAGKPIDVNDIEYFKKSVSSPLAAMGDMLFLGGMKPLALTFACIFAIYQSLTGLLAVLLLYNLAIVSCRFWGVYFGYSKGWGLVEFFSGPGFQRVLSAVQISGACAGGALTAIIVNALFKGGIRIFLLTGPLSLPGGVSILISGGVVASLAVFLMKRDISSTLFAIALFPISIFLVLVF
jgi:PTS system mannose-specific IID component